MLGAQAAHWAFTFNSEASLLEGNRIRDNGVGASPRFTTIGTVEGYAPLDQYLMGFRAPDEVPPTFYVANSGIFTRLPQVGVEFSGERRDIRIEEVIASEGRRTPDSTVAQRQFRFALILIVRAGRHHPPGGSRSTGTLSARVRAVLQKIGERPRHRRCFDPAGATAVGLAGSGSGCGSHGDGHSFGAKTGYRAGDGGAHGAQWIADGPGDGDDPG